MNRFPVAVTTWYAFQKLLRIASITCDVSGARIHPAGRGENSLRVCLHSGTSSKGSSLFSVATRAACLIPALMSPGISTTFDGNLTQREEPLWEVLPNGHGWHPSPRAVAPTTVEN
eukprot:CAMPEP_0114144084 /NCGR_PEP_ID=MMETSP0043_2-20121206/19323_1 /TAXON_ID=464988 /ORGANISM="Hemiselmis andersenii, Strain CCMP644" /LENGTH=115 /DNA_ID=CAMNT_0001238409 /DNA_START=1166 /DNA_END=1510 /DNA_ORIENTATION=-